MSETWNPEAEPWEVLIEADVRAENAAAGGSSAFWERQARALSEMGWSLVPDREVWVGEDGESYQALSHRERAFLDLWRAHENEVALADKRAGESASEDTEGPEIPDGAVREFLMGLERSPRSLWSCPKPLGECRDCWERGRAVLEAVMPHLRPVSASVGGDTVGVDLGDLLVVLDMQHWPVNGAGKLAARDRLRTVAEEAK